MPTSSASPWPGNRTFGRALALFADLVRTAGGGLRRPPDGGLRPPPPARTSDSLAARCRIRGRSPDAARSRWLLSIRDRKFPYSSADYCARNCVTMSYICRLKNVCSRRARRVPRGKPGSVRPLGAGRSTPRRALRAHELCRPAAYTNRRPGLPCPIPSMRLILDSCGLKYRVATAMFRYCRLISAVLRSICLCPPLTSVQKGPRTTTRHLYWNAP
jgi:hypothetical protein